MYKYYINNLKALILQFFVSILVIVLVGVFSALICTSCKDDYVDKTYRKTIYGTYTIKETKETVTFDEKGLFWYDNSKQYPEDYIYGNYVVNEDDISIIYCSYYVESYDIDKIDTMKIVMWENDGKTAKVMSAPTHKNQLVTFEMKF